MRHTSPRFSFLFRACRACAALSVLLLASAQETPRKLTIYYTLGTPAMLRVPRDLLAMVDFSLRDLPT